MGTMGPILEYRVVQPGPGMPRIHTLDGEVAGQVWAENVAATIRAGGEAARVEFRIFGMADEWSEVEYSPYTAGVRACDNEREPDGEVCTGTLTFYDGSIQAKCSVCGAWTGRLAPGHETAVKPVE